MQVHSSRCHPNLNAGQLPQHKTLKILCVTNSQHNLNQALLTDVPQQNGIVAKYESGAFPAKFDCVQVACDAIVCLLGALPRSATILGLKQAAAAAARKANAFVQEPVHTYVRTYFSGVPL